MYMYKAPISPYNYLQFYLIPNKIVVNFKLILR